MSTVALGVVVGGLSCATESSAAPIAIDASGQVASTDLLVRDQDVSRDDLRPALQPQPDTSLAVVRQASQFREERQVISDYQAEQVAKAKAAARKKALAQQKAAAERKRKAAARKRAERARIKAQGYEPGTTDPRSIAKQILKNKYGYGGDQYQCFNNIIMRESEWDIHATNASSGAYGIPQALPGSKMASVGADWRTNPATQIIWGIEYMKDTYGSPCSAWGFKSSHGWY